MKGIAGEQSLILKIRQGLVIITGCGHPGIVEIIKAAKKITNSQVYFVFGGFHLLQKTENQIKQIINEIKNLGVEKIGATHCSGDKTIEMFAKTFGKNFIRMGVGKTIKL